MPPMTLVCHKIRSFPVPFARYQGRNTKKEQNKNHEAKNGTTEAAIELKEYFERRKKTRFDFVNQLPEIKSCEDCGFKAANPNFF